jgi:hypothetical protein
MNRAQLEHLIRAASEISDEYELIIVGSAAILATVPDPPESLARTREADIYPMAAPEKADEIDAAIGEGSQFDVTYGYYAHGVGPKTAVLPDGWKGRLIKVQSNGTNNKIGYCLEAHDIAASKAIAGREKDKEFVREMINLNLINPETLRERIIALPVEDARIAVTLSWLFPQKPLNPQPAR